MDEKGVHVPMGNGKKQEAATNESKECNEMKRTSRKSNPFFYFVIKVLMLSRTLFLHSSPSSCFLFLCLPNSSVSLRICFAV